MGLDCSCCEQEDSEEEKRTEDPPLPHVWPTKPSWQPVAQGIRQRPLSPNIFSPGVSQSSGGSLSKVKWQMPKLSSGGHLI